MKKYERDTFFIIGIYKNTWTFAQIFKIGVSQSIFLIVEIAGCSVSVRFSIATCSFAK